MGTWDFIFNNPLAIGLYLLHKGTNQLGNFTNRRKVGHNRAVQCYN